MIDNGNDGTNIYLSLAAHFVALSLLAVGGAYSAMPEMHRVAVDVEHWLTNRQFADMFAISQVSPGPNVIIVTLIGYHTAGVIGAVVATVAMCGPTCVLAFAMTRVWDRFREARWRIAIQAGLVPLSVGLMAASVFVVAGAAQPGWPAIAIMIASAVAGFSAKFNPLWIFAAGALCGLIGWI